MSGNALKLGPFVGGLNNRSRTGEAKNNELVEMVNFEVTADDTITSRPPMEIISETVKASSPSTGIIWKILCVFRRSPSEWYLIVSEPNSAGTALQVSAYLNGNLSSTPIIIQASHSAENEVADAIQFADEVYFVRDVSASLGGFRWSPSGGFAEVTTMPRGRVLVSWKSRLWIGGRTDSSGMGARLFYSDIKPTGAEPYTWNTSVDYVDIAYGEGGFITSMIPLMGNLIIFKSDGTWRFSFPSQVKDGQVDTMSSSIGAASRWAAIEFENIIYVYDQGNVYELVNNQFTTINKTVELKEDTDSVNLPIADVEMSIFNRRIMIRYSNSIYSLNLETKAWSLWRSYNGVPSRFVEIPADSSAASSPTYFSASCGITVREEVILNNLTAEKISSKFGTVSVVNGDIVVPVGERLSLNPQFTEETLPQSFAIPVSTYTDLELTYYVQDVANIPTLLGQLLLPNGAYVNVTQNTVVVGNMVTTTLTVLSGTPVALRIYMDNVGADTVYMSGMRLKRKSTPAKGYLFRIKDEYADSATSKELIYCKARTKAMDFNSAQSWKRLFWWGMDIKTYFDTVATAIPASKSMPVLWRDIDLYTNNQLRQGTFRNPLSWLQISSSVFNLHGPESEISDDGRFFKKLAKALRFQRISFEFVTRTHGTLATGPAKLFTITAIVKDKKPVVDTNT